MTVCIQEACLRDFICITSTAICQPDIKGGGLAITAILIIVHADILLNTVVLSEINKAWRCSPGYLFYKTYIVMLRGGWSSPWDINSMNILLHLPCYSFLIKGIVPQHSGWMGILMYIYQYEALAVTWIGCDCLSPQLWRVSVCPCWCMAKHCWNHCPCACGGVSYTESRWRDRWRSLVVDATCLRVRSQLPSNPVYVHVTRSETWYKLPNLLFL